MNPDEVEPLRVGDNETEPLDPGELPYLQFAQSDDGPPHRSVRTWWFVVAAAVIVVVGMTVGIIVFNASAPDAARGAASANAAAKEFVAAVNAGNEQGAAAISCDTFVDEAKAAAQSGKDPGFRFTLDRVRADDKTSATAEITEHLTLPGNTKQTRSASVNVLRSSGRWLVCGRAL